MTGLSDTAAFVPRNTGLDLSGCAPYHWNSVALAEPVDKLSFLVALLDGKSLSEDHVGYHQGRCPRAS